MDGSRTVETNWPPRATLRDSFSYICFLPPIFPPYRSPSFYVPPFRDNYLTKLHTRRWLRAMLSYRPPSRRTKLQIYSRGNRRKNFYFFLLLWGKLWYRFRVTLSVNFFKFTLYFIWPNFRQTFLSFFLTVLCPLERNYFFFFLENE